MDCLGARVITLLSIKGPHTSSTNSAAVRPTPCRHSAWCRQRFDVSSTHSRSIPSPAFDPSASIRQLWPSSAAPRPPAPDATVSYTAQHKPSHVTACNHLGDRWAQQPEQQTQQCSFLLTAETHDKGPASMYMLARRISTCAAERKRGFRLRV